MLKGPARLADECRMTKGCQASSRQHATRLSSSFPSSYTPDSGAGSLPHSSPSFDILPKSRQSPLFSSQGTPKIREHRRLVPQDPTYNSNHFTSTFRCRADWLQALCKDTLAPEDQKPGWPCLALIESHRKAKVDLEEPQQGREPARFLHRCHGKTWTPLYC